MTDYSKLESHYLTVTASLLRSRGFIARKHKGKVKINIPSGVKEFKIDTPHKIIDLVNRIDAMFKPKESLYEDPPDVVMQKSGQFPEEKLPEHYGKYILPATTKPNIDRIKMWVQQVKMRGKTNEDILNEYNEWSGREQSTALTSKQKHSLADSIAYKISRKIWYVGRRPAELTDWEWNEMTKRMRPAKGTYSRNEKWKGRRGFPYTQSYIYKSGA